MVVETNGGKTGTAVGYSGSLAALYLDHVHRSRLLSGSRRCIGSKARQRSYVQVIPSLITFTTPTCLLFIYIPRILITQERGENND